MTPMLVRCPRCGQAYQAADGSAGSQIACGCGQAFLVPPPAPPPAPQPFVPSPLETALGARADGPSVAGGAPALEPWRTTARLRRRRRRAVEVAAWSGGIGLLALLAVLGLVRLSELTVWTVDRDLAAELSPPRAVDLYQIQPPRGFHFEALPQDSVTRDLRAWRLSGPDSTIAIMVYRRPEFRRMTKPDIRTGGTHIVHWTPDPVHVLPGARIDHGVIGSLEFTRALFDMTVRGELSITPDGGTGRYRFLYAAFDDDRYLHLTGSCDEPFDSRKFRVLEAAVRSFRPRRTQTTPSP